jgi:hypothetical protein
MIMTKTLSKYDTMREVFRKNFREGIKPVDGRQPIPDEVALAMIQELDVPKDAVIGVFDAFLILTSHLREQGYTNIIVLENGHRNLTSLQQKYYNSIKSVCDNSPTIKYYVPPMNNYNRCDMEFDVIIGNPPYNKSEKVGSQRGSANSALWWEITQQSLKLLKPNGIISFITPSNIVNGADKFTSIVLGNNRKYDLRSVDFGCSNSFKVGIPICRWVAINKVTPDNNVVISDGRILDATNTLKINEDAIYDEILHDMFNSEYDNLNFNMKQCYQYQQIESYLKKNNLPVEWAKDLNKTQDDVYQYPVNINGKIKYSRVKWRMNGTPRLFIPKMQNPMTVEYSKEWEADGSTFTMVFDVEEDALQTKGYLDNPLYRWVIEQTRVSGRLNANIICKLPNAPIEEVLTAEQLSYIQSQL